MICNSIWLSLSVKPDSLLAILKIFDDYFPWTTQDAMKKLVPLSWECAFRSGTIMTHGNKLTDATKVALVSISLTR